MPTFITGGSGRLDSDRSKPGMTAVAELKVKIFADGADLDGHARDVRQAVHHRLHDQPDADAQGRHHGLPRFAREVLAAIPDRPISFEVFSDDFAEMERQAREIASWGKNVYVKIPVTNTRASRRTS